MSYKSPIVLTSIFKSATMAAPTTTAISEAGIFSSLFGQNISIKRHTIPTTRACQLNVPIHLNTSRSFSIVSIGEFTNVSPRKSLICPIAIVTAIPSVKPVVIVNGINFMSAPSLNTPIRIKIIPASIVARTSPSIPFLATIPATIEANAAVGPAI